ncbi:MAG: 2'-5' RNA ligase family protein [Pyrinomonadaceae bacterium]|nr:2'-5' RNA ligase family protein [Pyrinomonadaceae bacterium]
MPPPSILTVKFDADSFGFFDLLRRKHFPPERNFLAAHITLFHHLPGEEIEHIEDELMRICADYEAFELHFPALRFLGKGTAAEIESAELIKLRSTLAARWEQWLTAQDKQKFKPHITIQNKVAPDEARRLFEAMRASWEAKTGNAVGLQLWHYKGGPWELANEFTFGNAAHE